MSNNSNDPIDQITDAFKALANRHRLLIFQKLSSCCTPGTACTLDQARLCVGDLGGDLDIAPSTLSHHIKELSRAGLVQTIREGKNVYCKVDPLTLSHITEWLNPATPPGTKQR